jgi:uncharacterized membrane protein YkoI
LVCTFLIGNALAGETQSLITPGQAISKAQQIYGGKVVGTELVKPPLGRPYYKVKIENNGRVRVIRIDATQD